MNIKKYISLTLVSLSLILLFQVPVLAEANPNTSTWFAYEYPTADEIEGGALDMSYLLDAPAGKHGYLSRTDIDNFMFEDGQEIEFWGINITAQNCFPEYDDAVGLAKRIAQNGFNIVRLHLLEAGEGDSIWGRKNKDGRVINNDAIDKMCFFISELKKRGVYVWIDQILSRPITADDNFEDLENVKNGLKEYGYFNDSLITFQKEFAKLIFNYYNPYTGLKIKDDPAIAIVEFKNEDSISDSDNRTSSFYDAALKKMFNDWLVEKYTSRQNLVAAWVRRTGRQSSSAVMLRDNEDPLAGTVELPGATERTTFVEARHQDSMEFLSQVQMDCFDTLYQNLEDIGVKCLVSGSTAWSSNGIERQVFYSNLDRDLINVHSYRGMTGSIDYTNGTTRIGAPISGLENYPTSIMNYIGARSVYGMPTIISEWNDVAPNKYRSDAPLLMAAYSSLRGINPFAFSWSDRVELGSTAAEYKKSTFGVADTPEFLAALPAAAMIFARNDVSEAQSGYYAERLKGREQYSSSNLYILQNCRDFEPYIGLIGKSGMSFDYKAYNESYNDNNVLYKAKKSYENNLPYVSITGELSSDLQNKVFKLNTPRSQAITGFISQNNIELDDVIFNINNQYATVYLNSLSDSPLYNCDEMLITAVGDTRNSGQVMSSDELTITNAGTSPVLCEPITGTVTIKTTDDVDVYALDFAGNEKTKLSVTKTSQGFSAFNMTAGAETMYYKICRKNKSNIQNTHVSFENVPVSDMFSDVDSSNASKKQIERMALYGYIEGTNGAFSPNSTITKRKFIKLMIKLLKYDRFVWYDSTTSPFQDLATTDSEFAEMSIAYNMGIIDRTKIWNYYKIYPNKTVTRGDAMVWAAKFLAETDRDANPSSSFSLASMSDYSSYSSNSNIEYYRKILGLGFLSPKNGKIAPNDNLTRAEAAELAYNLAWK